MAIPIELQVVIFSPSLILTAASVVTLIGCAILGFLEIKEIHLKYSKFSNASSSSSSTSFKVSSKVGMFLFYTPAFLVGVASFWIYPDGDFRFHLIRSAVIIHFFKRMLEVIFIHKYSGNMGVDSMIIIISFYIFASASLIYNQVLNKGLPEPLIDLKYPGIVVFIIGLSGNFYHHYLLSKLRSEGGKGYKIPKGGLFGLVICPHYLFEILGFVGISLISQTLYSFSVTLGIALYLSCRSCVTRKWYISKFEDFPKEVKAIIPYVF